VTGALFDGMRLEIARQQAEVRDLAYRDRLTGLPNRERFRQAVMQPLRHSPLGSTPLAVLLLIWTVSSMSTTCWATPLATACCRPWPSACGPTHQAPDLVARWAATNLLLLHDADPTRALKAAQTIVQAEAPLELNEQTVDLSAALGIACWPATPPTPTDCSTAPKSPCTPPSARSVWCRCTTLRWTPPARRRSLLGDLRRAVEQDELRLFLQPKVALQGHHTLAAEALVRWQHPQRGLVPPMQFIPFAEQTGFVRQLTLWVFEAAARWQAQPQARALGVRVSVNLSTRDLLDPDLSHRLDDILQRHGVAATAFAWRSPKAPSWTTPSAPRPCSTAWRSRGSGSPSTTSAPLFVTRLPAPPAGTGAQDRQVLRHGHAKRRG
jgi:predicted signal transduction protein with EAL and GGDEF domain